MVRISISVKVDMLIYSEDVLHLSKILTNPEDFLTMRILIFQVETETNSLHKLDGIFTS